MRSRFSDTNSSQGPKYLFEFAQRVLVECPGCGQCAVVECKRGLEGTPCLSCPRCSFTTRGWPPPSNLEMRRCARRRCARCNDWLGRAPVRFLMGKRVVEILCTCGAVSFEPWPRAAMRLGESTDPYFGLPLWLRTDVRGETLWAYNREHLSFLDAYVRAALRQRAPNWNASLTSRLPRWMKTASRRQDVLKAIARIAARKG